MTSLADCLLDAGKKIRGSDVAEDFVTARSLARLQKEADLVIDPLDAELPATVDCLIYTAAHQGREQRQVQAALAKGLPVYSHAEALAELFNQKLGLAVCGVGGKSTVSAMLTWILHKLQPQALSYSVGVGEIVGLQKTGQWLADSRYFVAEADEYVIDPQAASKGQAMTPRFSFLQPHLTICTNLRFDHPDVYRDLTHTQATFHKFFSQIKTNGFLLVNGDDENLNVVLPPLRLARPDLQVFSFGEQAGNDFLISQYQLAEGQNSCQLKFAEEECRITLQLPGRYNLRNAAAAVAACHSLGISLQQAAEALADFRSTSRRFQLVKTMNGKQYFDDYAHHPSEVAAVIQALQQSFPEQKRLIAFQPHTYSRTKQLLDEFVTAFGQNLGSGDQLVLLDIFPSAREAADPSVSSDLLVSRIQESYPQLETQNLHDLASLAEFMRQTDYQVAITLGAGDIYQVYDLL